MCKLCFTNKAVEDLSSIWRYTFQEWSEKQADEYYEMLISACNRILGESIVLNRSYDEIAENLYGFKAGHHMIFYRELPNGDVSVIRILHERMDLKRHFPKRK